MPQTGLRSPIQLEWFNITYRSLFFTVGLSIVGVLGGGAYWFYSSWIAPKGAAATAISQAEDLYQQARAHSHLPDLRETVERAGRQGRGAMLHGATQAVFFA